MVRPQQVSGGGDDHEKTSLTRALSSFSSFSSFSSLHGDFGIHFTTDDVVGNHFVATHPKSPFATRVHVQRLSAEKHVALDAETP
ncbi:hypothetical protein SAMN05216268_106414 [Streptomyces yunnanensis]|uniref:Uncharacterized protein n=2 Tax=Streptomyces yunnanensis TaxID=156453 RepID=A0A9X8MUB8_9ACTN|nr:hypothetical protein SAMN05216268_106414 [Streptomyces yunnanensis]